MFANPRVDDIKEEPFTFEWSVSKEQIDRDGETLLSPVHEHNGRSWRLQLERYGADLALDLKIGLVSSPVLPVMASYRFISVDEDRSVYLKGKTELFQQHNTFLGYEKLFSLDWPRHVTHRLTSYLSNKKLNIFCEVEVFKIEPVVHRSHHLNFGPSHSPQPDFSSLLDASHFDVNLVAGEKEFRAHKVVLSARSPIFAKMFEVDMKEKSTNKVNIDDIEAEILQKMLLHIYSGRNPLLNKQTNQLLAAKLNTTSICQNYPNTSQQIESGAKLKPTSTPAIENEEQSPIKIPIADIVTTPALTPAIESEADSPPPADPCEEAKKLLYAADKYQIEGLVKCCETFLSEHLTVDNVAETVLLADKHNATQLRKSCSVFIANNHSAVSETSGWSDVLAERSILQDILQASLDKHETPPTAKRLRLEFS